MIALANHTAIKQDERRIITDGLIQQFIQILEQIKPPVEFGEARRFQRYENLRNLRQPPHGAAQRDQLARADRADGDFAQHALEIEDTVERCAGLFQQHGGGDELGDGIEAHLDFAGVDGRPDQPIPKQSRPHTGASSIDHRKQGIA